MFQFGPDFRRPNQHMRRCALKSMSCILSVNWVRSASRRFIPRSHLGGLAVRLMGMSITIQRLSMASPGTVLGRPGRRFLTSLCDKLRRSHRGTQAFFLPLVVFSLVCLTSIQAMLDFCASDACGVSTSRAVYANVIEPDIYIGPLARVFFSVGNHTPCQGTPSHIGTRMGLRPISPYRASSFAGSFDDRSFSSKGFLPPYPNNSDFSR